MFGNTQQQLQGPNPYQPKQLMPNPQAALGALLPALQQAAQKQASSQAASQLARQSHPQTLGQPPKQGNVGTTSGQAQPNTSPASPQSVGGAASAPPGTLGAQVNSLQQQIVDAQAQAAKAQQALQNAMAQPQPTMPTYTAPTMQQQNPGMVLGAALSALFAPKYAQGAIGALGVDQENRQKAYDNATTAAKAKWDANLSSYEDQAKRRQEGIENADKLGAGFDRQLTGLNRDLTTAENDELIGIDKDDALKERIRNDNLVARGKAIKHDEYMQTRADRNTWHNDTLNHWGQQLGLREEQLRNARDRTTIASESLRWQIKKYGLSEKDAAYWNGMKIATSLVVEKNREESHAAQAQNSAAFRSILQAQHDFDQMFSQLSNPAILPAQKTAILQKLQNYEKTPQGQQWANGLKAYGINPDDATSTLDSLSGADAVTDSSTAAAAGGTAAPAGSGVTINIGNQQGGGLGGVSGGGQSVADMLKEVGVTGASITSGAPGGNGGHTPPPPGLDKEALAANTSSYQNALSHFHDPAKAWAAIRDTVAGNIQARGGTADAKTVEAYRRAIMRGGSNQGNAQKPPVKVPTHPNPTPTERPRPTPTTMPTAVPTVPPSSDATPPPNMASQPAPRPVSNAAPHPTPGSAPNQALRPAPNPTTSPNQPSGNPLQGFIGNAKRGIGNAIHGTENAISGATSDMRSRLQYGLPTAEKSRADTFLANNLSKYKQIYKEALTNGSSSSQAAEEASMELHNDWTRGEINLDEWAYLAPILQGVLKRGDSQEKKVP